MPEEQTEKRKKFRIRRLYYFDYSLLLILILLFVIGLVMLYSVSAYKGELTYGDPAYYLKRQALFGAVGFICILLLCRIDYRLIEAASGVLYVVALVLCIAVIFLGTEGNGSTRSFRLGPVSVQPSEIAKVCVIIFLAHIISRGNKSLKETGNIIKTFLLVVPFFLAVAYNNLSTAIIIAGIAFFMLFIASPRTGIFLGLLLFAVVGIIAFTVLQGYRSERIAIWLHPENYPKGYQTLQGLYAIGSGGLFGRGLGASMQKMGFVPEAQNDMIFSIICEELGIVGAIGLIVLYILFCWRCLVIAINARDQFGSYLVIGIMIHIALQVILNIAVVTNSIPNTGITLPFISYGGSALVILMLETGIVLSVSGAIELSDNSVRAEY